MARDRLAQARAQGLSSTATAVTTNGSHAGEPGPPRMLGQPSIPLQDFPLTMERFMTEVDIIRASIHRLRDTTVILQDAHARALALPLAADADAGGSAEASERASAQSRLAAELSSTIRSQIVQLNNLNRARPGEDEGEGGGGRLSNEDGETRRVQLESLQKAFKNALEELFRVEKEARERARNRIERQYRVVKPDATDEQLEEALAGSVAGRQIFAEALVSTRAPAARSAFAESQYRNAELRDIEHTMSECAQLMNDMANLVLTQDYAFESIERDAEQVHEDTQAGHSEVSRGVKLARAARRKKWWLLALVLLIIIAIAVPIAIAVAT